MIIVLPLLVLLVFGLSSSTGGSSGASSSRGKSSHKETVIYQPQPQQQQQQVIVVPSPSGTPQQQTVVQPAPASQATQASPVRNFAVKSYGKISKDWQNGGGEYLNSLILLMESEGIPKDEALPLIRRALRKSNGNAEVFGDELEKSL
jgi:hypothetical protein